MEQQRRDFIKRVTLLSLALGLNPFKVLPQNFSESDLEDPKVIEDVNQSIEQFGYVSKILNRDIKALKSDYDKLYKISTSIASPKFRGYDRARQVRTVAKLEKKIDRVKVTKSQVRSAMIDNSTPDWATALNAAGFGYGVTSTVFSGVQCLAGLLGLPYGATVPIVATSCPAFILSATFTTVSGSQLMGSSNRNTSTLQYSTNNLVNVVRNNPSNRFLNDDAYNFEVGDINLSDEPDTFQVPLQATSPAETDFQDFLKRELSKGGLIMNEQNLRAFLEEYIEKSGQVQAQLIAEYIEESNQARFEKQKLLKEKAAFYKSVSQLTSVFFSSILPPKEAEILSILANVGFEYMATGVALGPYGWGAVGIQIATVLLSSKNGSGEFQKYLLKSLEHINKQLETINKKLDDIYYNQIDILVELHEISSKIDSLSSNVLNGLEQISTRLNDLSVSIDEQERNKYYRQVQTSNLNLNDKLIDRSSPITNNEVFLEIQNLRNNFVIHLNDGHFTNEVNGNLDGNLLKEEIYASFNYLTKVSLYDKIGLFSALFQYSTANTTVSTNRTVYHPIESYAACQNITAWLTLSSLSKGKSLQLTKEIERNISASIQALNQYGDLDVVTTKAEEYREFHHQLIHDAYQQLEDMEAKLFANSPRKWLQAVRLTPEDYSLTSSPWNRSNANYNDNMTDISYFDVLRDFGIIKRIRTVSDSPLDMGEKTENPRVGKVIGSRVLEVEFNSFTINHKQGKGTIHGLKIRYNKTAKCTTQSSRRESWTSCVDVFCDTYYTHYYRPTAYSINVDFLSKWKKAVGDHYRSITNDDIKTQIQEFASMSFQDFTRHLMSEYVAQKKLDLVNNTYAGLFERNPTLNGIGTSLMALSLLNKTITSDVLYPFVIDYLDEAYKHEDFSALLQKYYFSEPTEKQRDLEEELRELSRTYQLEIDGETRKLNPQNWKDYICLLLKHRIELTIERSLTGCQKLEPKDAEPYLADAMNKLHWFKNTYLKLRA